MPDKTLCTSGSYIKCESKMRPKELKSILNIYIINQELFLQEDTKKPHQTPYKASNACQKA